VIVMPLGGLTDSHQPVRAPPSGRTASRARKMVWRLVSKRRSLCYAAACAPLISPFFHLGLDAGVPVRQAVVHLLPARMLFSNGVSACTTPATPNNPVRTKAEPKHLEKIIDVTPEPKPDLASVQGYIAMQIIK
jgi:hypothetical protein